jgi:hypothetical protein
MTGETATSIATADVRNSLPLKFTGHLPERRVFENVGVAPLLKRHFFIWQMQCRQKTAYLRARERAHPHAALSIQDVTFVWRLSGLAFDSSAIYSLSRIK